MFNKVMLIGHLGSDPEVRYTPSGVKTCRFSLATSEKFEQNGEMREKTEWHNVIAWNKLADICEQYLSKGKQVFIEGKIRYESWEKDGVKHYSTKIIANTMKMLGKKDSSSGSGENYAGGQSGEEDFPF